MLCENRRTKYVFSTEMSVKYRFAAAIEFVYSNLWWNSIGVVQQKKLITILFNLFITV